MVRPGVHRREFGVLALSPIDPRLVSVCVCLVSIGLLGAGYFEVVPTGLHFLYAFRGSLPGSFEPRRRPWGGVPHVFLPRNNYVFLETVTSAKRIKINLRDLLGNNPL